MVFFIPNGCMQCGVCEAVCPKSALSLVKNEIGNVVGFEVSEGCINCSLCSERCPINFTLPMKDAKECHATRVGNAKRSSSGGVVTSIVKAFVEAGGYACVSIEMENCTAKHVLTNDLSVVEKSVGSKYIVSDTIDVFPEIETKLKGGDKVLYVSISCQVAALYAYLGVEYDNLYTIDLLCSANITKEVFQKHLADRKATGYIHRYSGGVGSQSSIILTDGSVATELSNDGMVPHRLERHICMTGCLKCQHHTCERIGDMTCGDYWGRFKYHSSLSDPVSLVMINSNRLSSFYNDLALDFDIVLTREQAKHSNCIDFEMQEDAEELNALYHNEFKTKPLGAIKRNRFDIELSACTTVPNYGSVLLSWSAYKYLTDCGYSVRLNAENIGLKKGFDGSPTLAFQRGYGSVDIGVGEAEVLLRTGDQQWNYEYNKDWYAEQLYRGRKGHKIAYGVSFGRADGGFVDGANIADFKDDFKSFNSIGVREDNDVQLLKNVGVNAERVADCAFLLNKNDYEEVMSEPVIDGDYFVVYDLYGKLSHVLRSLSDKYRIPVVYIGNYGTGYYNPIHKKIGMNYKPEEFLRLVHDAKAVVTNSLHGVYFSMIFGVPVTVIQERTDDARFATLKNIYGINAHAEDYANLSKAYYDFSAVDNTIRREGEISRLWLSGKLSNYL